MKCHAAISSMSSFSSLEEAHTALIGALLSEGAEVRPRGIRTLELTSVAVRIEHPRKRCITNPARHWSLALAIGEFCWHASASDDVDFVAYYAPAWRRFSPDEKTVRGSCYGKKIFDSMAGESQWEKLLSLLRSDPDSRRAVLNFHGSNELDASSPDVACASTLQFLIRDGAVHAVTYMRSNDVIWGMPYDIFLFTMLQELLSRELGLRLGSYHHMVASLHLYTRHLGLAHAIISGGSGPDFRMPEMGPASDLPRFLDLERQVRTSALPSTEDLSDISGFWRDLLAVLVSERMRRQHNGLAIRALCNTPYSAFIENLAASGSEC